MSVGAPAIDFMSRLKPKNSVQRGYSFAIIGAHGTGKTTIIDDPTYRILYLGVEAGEAVLPDRENITIYQNESGIIRWKDIIDTLEWLEASPDHRAMFDYVVLDGFGRMFELAMSHALEITPQVKRMAAGVPAQADWNHFPRLFKDVVKRFHELTKMSTNKKPFHFVIIGHTQEVRDEVTGVVEHKINLPGRDTGDVLGSVVDVVGVQMIIHRKPKDQPEAEPIPYYTLWLKPTQYGGKAIHAKIRIPLERVDKVPLAIRDASMRKLLTIMEEANKAEQPDKPAKKAKGKTGE